MGDKASFLDSRLEMYFARKEAGSMAHKYGKFDFSFSAFNSVGSYTNEHYEMNAECDSLKSSFGV